jgi:hypothetical protein
MTVGFGTCDLSLVLRLCLSPTFFPVVRFTPPPKYYILYGYIDIDIDIDTDTEIDIGSDIDR